MHPHVSIDCAVLLKGRNHLVRFLSTDSNSLEKGGGCELLAVNVLESGHAGLATETYWCWDRNSNYSRGKIPVAQGFCEFTQ